MTRLLNATWGGWLATPSGEGERATAHFWCIALGTWLGIHALRAYVPMAVWSLGDALPVALKGIPAALIFLIGLLAWPARRAFGGARPSLRFAIALALFVILRQASLWNPILAITFSFAAWITWMWWLPAAVKNTAADNALSVVAPAAMCGVALQLALQAALHGLDLPLWPAWPTMPAAALLATAFVVATHAAQRAGRDAGTARDWDASPEGAQLCAGATRGLVAFGAWFFLQLTLLASLGRIAQAMAWSQTAAAAFLAGSLLLGAAATLYPSTARVRWALGVFAVLWLPVLYRAGSLAVWLLPLAQVSVALLLTAAFTPRTPPPGLKPGPIYGGAAIGLLLFFVLLFLFYNAYEMPALWALAFAAVAAMGVTPARSQSHRALVPLYMTTALVIIGVAASALRIAAPVRPDVAPGDLRVMTFNVHQGYDYRGLPSLPRIARTIEAAAPDLVGLQEVNRGWDMLGGNDVVGWLRWRLPMYEVVYGPTHRTMWGNAVLSRYAVASRGSSPFATQAARFHYGFAWVRIRTVVGDVLFATAHLAPHLTGGTLESRAAQAGELLGLWGEHPHTLITGDFNSDPDDPAIRQTIENGIRDLGGFARQGTTFTSPVDAPRHRIDYIFATPDVSLLSAAVLPSLASDHLAAVANVRLK
jgi:endonuclease/exonuclease/phosphatase family metal-dependent hydrolase